MPREEGFGKQTQVMFRRGWSADDVTAKAYPVSIKLEADFFFENSTARRRATRAHVLNLVVQL